MTEENRTETNDRTAVLVTLAEQLINEIEGLAKDSGRQFVTLARRARTNRMLIMITIASVTIDLVLTAVLTLIGVSMQHNTDRIDALTQRLDTAQTVQRQKALCPLYQIFLDSKSTQGRAAAPDPKKYDHAFVVIADGYKALDCDRYITGS
jgi:type VI protein secretion system component VasK